MRRLRLPLIFNKTDENILGLFLYGRSYFVLHFCDLCSCAVQPLQQFFQEDIPETTSKKRSLEKTKDTKTATSQIWPNIKNHNTKFENALVRSFECLLLLQIYLIA